MRKVIYAMSVSLDGFIEATNGDLRWSYPDEELHKHFKDREAGFGFRLVARFPQIAAATQEVDNWVAYILIGGISHEVGRY